ncbi:MAG: hypothetical protein SFX19_09410 [Alphaproteobacteria bacterium]|nr:hypothetical protein [Alphaproteobacteria bacterium]
MIRAASPPPLSPEAVADLLCTLMLLCRGKNAKNQPIWAYLCIKPSMAGAFKEARERGNIDVSEYGTVIEAGAGEEPPEDVKRRMERDYGVNHLFEKELLDAAAEHCVPT